MTDTAENDAPPCDMCGHVEHHDTDCGEVVGYDHLNGDHECECPGSLADQLAQAWDDGHGTSNGGCVYWPDCAEIGHHVNPYRTRDIPPIDGCACGCGCEPDGDWHWSQQPWCRCVANGCPCVTDTRVTTPVVTMPDAENDAPREHVLKVAPEYWHALVDGSKTFEVRRNDRAYQKGDVLVLYPTHIGNRKSCKPDCTHPSCTSRPPVERRIVSYVYSGDPRFNGHGGLQPGHVVLGLTRVFPPGGDS